MIIQVLGSGCPSCHLVEKNARKAVTELGLKEAKIEHIYDIAKIIEMGVMMTPALAVEGKIVIAGKIPSVNEIKKLLTGFKK